jgi:hypothetical protein
MRRGAVYYVRKVFPPKLRPILGKSAYVVSLHATDLEMAKARHAVAMVKVNQMIARARLTLQHPEVAAEGIAWTMVKGEREPIRDNENAWLAVTPWRSACGLWIAP